MSDQIYDLVIVGGGINGVGIAADAAGRGLTVLLAEMNDLGSATSSASSKLIHGGLRYLEHYEFGLVRSALGEREVLLRVAPHIVWPLRFVLPHVPGMRPRAMIRAGLFLYDQLAPRQTLPASRTIDLAQDPAGGALDRRFAHAFSYWDCWVDDARLVVLNARQAANHGARICPRTKVVDLRVEDTLWRVTLDDGTPREVRARAIINAAGPWTDRVAAMSAARPSDRAHSAPRLKLVKGSHIVVPRIAGADCAYLLQNADGRVVFALPFEDRFTLIGTTDVAYEGDPAGVSISMEEQSYLLDVAGRFFRAPIPADAVVWRYAGVRPLYDNERGGKAPSALSRDYRLDLDTPPGGPLRLTVLGGKITTYRKLAEAALSKLAPHFPAAGPAWTAKSVLPGGDFGPGGRTEWTARFLRRRSGFSVEFLQRLVRRYGTDTDTVLGDARVPGDLGEDFGGGLCASEVVYVRDREWARTTDDVLWRRTKAGLHLAPDDRLRAQEAMANLF